jgi:hypothetical protein
MLTIACCTMMIACSSRRSNVVVYDEQRSRASPQTVGTTSMPQSLSLTNTGDKPLVFSQISLTRPHPEDLILTNSCPSTVAVGGNCSLTVAFSPNATRIAGKRAGHIQCNRCPISRLSDRPRPVTLNPLPQGLCPSVPFLTPSENGVTTGVAAPINTATSLSE